MAKGIWKQCKSKHRYRDEHEANYSRKKYERARGIKLDYYWCPHCNGFHLTSSEIFYKYNFYDENGDLAIAVG